MSAAVTSSMSSTAARRFASAPRERRIVVASRTNCVAYGLASGEKLSHIPALSGALSLDAAADGRLLAGIVAVGDAYVIRLCDLQTTRLLCQSPPLEQPFYTACFSPDSGSVASGHAGGRIVVWGTGDLSPRSEFRCGGTGLLHPFFSPDGKTLGGGDQSNGDTFFWDLATGHKLHKYTFERGAIRTVYTRNEPDEPAPERAPHRFVFSPGGDAFLAGPEGGILRLIETGQDILRLEN